MNKTKTVMHISAFMALLFLAAVLLAGTHTRTVLSAEVDNTVYRLAHAISTTQKRANALKNIVIPRYEEQIRTMTADLEEKEREEFSRMKVIKANKEKQNGSK